MEFIILSGLLYVGYNLSMNDQDSQINLNIDEKEKFVNSIDSKNIYDYGYYKDASKVEFDHATNSYENMLNKKQNPMIIGKNKPINDLPALDEPLRPKDKEFVLESFADYDNLENMDILEIQEQDEKRMFFDKYKSAWHNNMNPFYGSNVKQNVSLETNMPILDRYTATEYRPERKEIPNMFELEPNTTNVYGDISVIKNIEESKNRFVPSIYQQNIQPIESQKVGPGLNLPSDVVAREGWQEMTRILPPTTNELRALNNPKEEYEGRTLQGKFINTNRGLLPKMTKFKTMNIVENKCGERNYVTTGAVIKPSAPEKYIIRKTNRNKCNKEIRGNAFSASELKITARSKIRESNKTNYCNNYQAPIHNQVSAPYVYSKNEFVAKNTFRQEYEDQNPISNMVSFVKNMFVGPSDEAKCTKKQNTIINIRKAENPHLNSQTTAHFTDTAKQTIKQQLAANPTQSLNVSNTLQGNIVYDKTNVPKQTIKETTCQENIHSNIYSVEQKGFVIDPEHIAKTTIKETTLSENPYGNIIQSNQGNVIYNPLNLPKTTVKETTLSENPYGNISNNSRGNIIYDPSQQPKTTIKQTTIQENIYTNASNTMEGNVVYNPENIAKNTIKQTLLHETAHANAFDINQGTKIYDPNDTAKVTMKQIVSSQPQEIANAQFTSLGNIVYDPSNTMKTTVKETTLTNQPVANMNNPSQGNVVYDPCNVPKATIKETTTKQQEISNVANSSFGNVVYDPRNKAKTTIKESTISEQKLSNVSNSNQGNVIYDSNDIARHTIKETTMIEDYLGNVSAHDMQSGDAYKVLKIKPRYTSRQDIECNLKNNYMGHMGSNNPQSTNQYQYKNMTTNALKEKIALGREPTQNGTKVAATKNEIGMSFTHRNSENTNVDMSNPSLIEEFEIFKNKINNSDIAGTIGKVVRNISIEEIGCETKHKNVVEYDQHIDVSLLDAFKSNPYTQSLHSAV